MLSPERADALFAALAAEFTDRKTTAEARVAAWKWGTRLWFDSRPLYFERQNDRPGRILKKPPTKTHDRVEVGFDADGEVVVVREHTEIGPYETFHCRRGSIRESARYHFYANAPINILCVSGPAVQPSLSDLVAEQGWVHEEYVWRDECLAEARVSYTPRVAGHYLTLQPLHVAVAEYVRGQLQRVELHWPPLPPGRPEPVVEIAYLRADA